MTRPPSWPTRRATSASRTFPLPHPGPDEAVVEVAYGGICGSDLHYWRTARPASRSWGAAGARPRDRRHGTSRPPPTAPAPGRGTAVAVHPATPGRRRSARYPADRPNLPRAAPTWAAPRASRTPTAPSAGTPPCRPGCSGRCPTAWTCVPPRWPNPPRRLARVRGPGTWRARRALVIGAGPIGALAVAVLQAGRCGADRRRGHAHRPLEIARPWARRGRSRATTRAIEAVQADVVIESSGSHHGWPRHQAPPAAAKWSWWGSCPPGRSRS